MNFNNKILTLGIIGLIGLIALSSFSLIWLSNAWNMKAYGQLQSPPLEQGLDVRITSLAPNQQIPAGNLTISGTSNYDKPSDCTVYVGLNDFTPFQKAFANGTNGVNDYTTWNFTFSPSYHQIMNGTNKLDSVLSCLDFPKNITQTYSLNVTGVLNGTIGNQSSDSSFGSFSDNAAGTSGDPNSFTTSEEYKQGSEAFRACIDAAASVGNKLSDYEIQNCRDDPSYRHGEGNSDLSSGGDSGIDSISTSDSSSSDSSDSGSSDSGSDNSGDPSSTRVCSNGNAGSTKINDGEFNIGAAGDWSGSKNACNTALNMDSKGVDLALGLGDYAYSSGFEGVTSWWEDVMTSLHGKFKGALGNHDTQDENAYAHYFGQSGPWFYSFNEHGVHFLAIDLYTSFGPGSAQYKFVSNDLASASTDPAIKWILVYFHEPMYTSPSHHPPVTSLRNAYHPLFDRYGVDIVLQGHNHNYQRTYPITYNTGGSSGPLVTSKETAVYNDPAGEIYAEVGTGGQNSYALDGKSPFVYKQFTTSGGFLNLAFPDVRTMKATYYDNDGSIKDQFTINKPGTGPVAFNPVDDVAVTSEDTPVVIPVLSNDRGYDHQPDVSSIKLGASTKFQPTHGSVIVNNNETITYVPDSNYYGTDSFNYTLASINGNTPDQSLRSAQVSVKVNTVNDAPVANDDSAIVEKDGYLPVVNIISNDTDPDGDALKVTEIGDSNSNGTIVNNDDGTISYRPSKGYIGKESFIYTVSDNHNASARATLTIAVNEANVAPVSFDQNLNTTVNTGLPIKLSATDLNKGTVLTYSLVSEPLHGTISGFEKTAGVLNYIPNQNYSGSDALTFIASDGQAKSNIATIRVNINPSIATVGALASVTNGSIGTATVRGQNVSALDIGQNAIIPYLQSNISLNQTDEAEVKNPLLKAASNFTHSSGSIEGLNYSNIDSAGLQTENASGPRFVNLKAAEEAQIVMNEAQGRLDKLSSVNGSVGYAIQQQDNIKLNLLDNQRPSAILTKDIKRLVNEKAAELVSVALSNAEKHQNNKPVENNIPSIEPQSYTNNLVSQGGNGSIAVNKAVTGNHKGLGETVSPADNTAEIEQANFAVLQAQKQLQNKIDKNSDGIAHISAPTPNKGFGLKEEHEQGNNKSLQPTKEIHSKVKVIKSSHELSHNDKKEKNSSIDKNTQSNKEKPQAYAGRDLTLVGRKIITLDGGKSSSSSHGELSYAWKQIQGPKVVLTTPGEKISSFETPLLSVGKDKTILKFELTVTDHSSGSVGRPADHDTDQIKITVKQKDFHPNFSADNIVKANKGNHVTHDVNQKLGKKHHDDTNNKSTNSESVGNNINALSNNEDNNNDSNNINSNNINTENAQKFDSDKEIPQNGSSESNMN